MKYKRQIVMQENELVLALRNHENKGAKSGLTTTEISNESGISKVRIRQQLRTLQAADMLAIVWEYRQTLAGYKKRVPVFYLKTPRK